MMNYEDLTKRIESAEKAMHKSTGAMEGFWGGYVCALKDVRNDINTGGKK